MYKMMVRLIFEKSGCEILATASGVTGVARKATHNNQCGSMFGCEP